MVGTLVRDCRCAKSWCDLDLTFDLAVVTLTYKILTFYLFSTYRPFLSFPGSLSLLILSKNRITSIL